MQIVIKIILVHSTMNMTHERIFRMTQLIFLKRDLTRPINILQHFSTDIVNTILDELGNYELIRKGREFSSITFF